MQQYFSLRFLYIYPVFFLLFFGLISCTKTSPAPTAPVLSPAFAVFSGEYKNTEYMKTVQLEHVSILPFGDARETEGIRADEAVPEMLAGAVYSHLQAFGVNVQNMEQTKSRLKKAGLYSAEDVTALLHENPKHLQAVLGTDVVVTGRVTHYDESSTALAEQTFLGCELQLVTLPEKHILWYAVQRPKEGGSIRARGLMLSVLSRLWAVADSAFFANSYGLIFEMLGTIKPGDTYLNSYRHGIGMELFALQRISSVGKGDEMFLLRVSGSAGQTGRVEISGQGFKKEVALAPASMEERRVLRADLLAILHTLSKEPFEEKVLAATMLELDKTEVYQATFVPESGSVGEDVTVRAVLYTPQGQISYKTLPYTISFDVAPPRAPQDLIARVKAGGDLHITWNPVRAEDANAYEVWTSSRGLSGFTLAKTTTKPEVKLTGLPFFKPVFIRITVVDRAGNRSPFSYGIKAIPLPWEDVERIKAVSSFLPEVLKEDIYLHPELSPYIVKDFLRVPAGISVYIAPGVKIFFKPDAKMTVSGGHLFIYGTAENPVYLGTQSKARAWGGIALYGSQKAFLSHTVIRGAKTGLYVKDTRLKLYASRIEECTQGGVISEDNARIDASCSVFAHNTGRGGILISGENTVVSFKNTVFQENEPYNAINHIKKEIQLGHNFWQGPPERHTFGPLDKSPELKQVPAVCY